MLEGVEELRCVLLQLVLQLLLSPYIGYALFGSVDVFCSSYVSLVNISAKLIDSLATFGKIQIVNVGAASAMSSS